ncbi:MAG: DUF5671 domain-containing protein [Chloroflexota bacterium]
MRTVRRLYFYAVALISLEIVLWGLVGLARSILSSLHVFQAGAFQLAQALALILVGVPVFGFHWLMAQRFARREPDERASGIRAAFLYGVLLGTLIPVVQNTLALVNRPALTAMRLASSRAFVGGQQIWSDNLIAILMNLIVAAYFFTVLRADWKVVEPRENFVHLRRIYRWIWVLYGLGLTVSGLDQVLRFLLSLGTGPMSGDFQRYWAVNGMVVTVVGAPIWAYAWLSLQRALAEPGERESFLRLGLLYLLSLTGVIVTLSTGGFIVDSLLRLVFGNTTSFQSFIGMIDGPLAACVPFLGIWLYYGHWLNRAMSEVSDTPRRSGMRRVYLYILSALGLTVTFIGLAMLLAFVIDMGFVRLFWGDQTLVELTASLSALIVGLPLWLLTWRPMQAEALASGDAGDHARRSITRKIYLYLALFTGVIGGMITAVVLLYTLLSALFGQEAFDLLQDVLTTLEVLFLFIGLGVYHGLMLGRDNKLAASALSEKHAAFPALIFDPGDGFGPALLAAVQKTTPRLPIELQPVSKPVPASAKPRAVILPSDVALDPPESLRKWLGKFDGSRLVVPRAAGKWTLVGQAARLPVNQAAQALRQLAEGQEVRAAGTPGWLIAVYVVAGIIGLPFLFSLISALVSAFMY